MKVGQELVDDENLRRYLPPQRKVGLELNKEQRARLAKVGLTSEKSLEIASNVYFRWVDETKRHANANKKLRPINICEILAIEEEDFEGWNQAQTALLEHITAIRRHHVTPRDGWGDWLDVSLDCKTFCATYVMLMTPGRYDKVVEVYARDFIENKGIDCPEKMLQVFHEEGGEYEDCVKALANSIRGLGFWNMTPSYIIQMSIICIILDRVPATYEELLAYNGSGMKIASVVMYEVYKKVCGIPVDTHMKKAFNALRWAHSKSNDTVARQVAIVVPEEYHGRLNETFAGLGQILQSSGEEREELIADLLDVPEPWMLEPIHALLAVYEEGRAKNKKKKSKKRKRG